MTLITKPMLAGKLEQEDLDSLKFPLLVTEKLDGIRCLILDGKAVSRNLKPIPNKFIRDWLEANLIDGLDGELVIENDSGQFDFSLTQSHVMSFDGEPHFKYVLFDYVKDDLNKPYVNRVKDLKAYFESLSEQTKKNLICLEPKEVKNKEEIVKLHDEYVKDGFEGIILRTPNGKYKCGRSGIKEAILLKLKYFQDSEGFVIGFIEKNHNGNEAEQDLLGHTKRSMKKANMIGMETLGSLIVRDKNMVFGLGSGFNDEERQDIWDNQEKYKEKYVTYQYQSIGSQGLPRFPTFKGFRDKRDM